MNAPVSKTRRTSFSLWLLAAVVGMVLLMVGLLAFGPNPPIVVGRATTRITAPLAADGLPDYSAALLAELRKGRDGQPITPEKNGAIPLLAALWPTGDEAFSDEDAALLCAELGIDPPAVDQRFTSLSTREMKIAVVRLLRERLPKPNKQTPEGEVSDPFFDGPEEDAIEDQRVVALISNCQPIDRPWKRDDLPPIADWIDENAAAFDLLLEATERPEWYCPSPELLKGGRGEIISMLLSIVQESRSAARALTTRAYLALGEGRPADAARDTRAVLRLADHIRTGRTLVEQLVGCAIEGIGHKLVRDVAADAKTPPEALRKLAHTLDAIDSRPPLLASFDVGERFFGLDISVAIASGVKMGDFIGAPPIDGLTSWLSIDWNPVLESHNAFFDDLLKAAKAPTWSQRQTALDALDSTLNTAPSPGAMALGALTPSGRGNVAADVFRNLLTPALASVFTADDRVTANRQLTRVAVALALFRADKGEYPAALAELTPDYLPAAPVDLFHASPLVYQKTDDGYLLYTLGANGKDDGGSCEQGSWGEAKLAGVVVEEQDAAAAPSEWDAEGNYVGVAPAKPEVENPLAKIPAGADDLSLRMPPEVGKWPWEQLE